MSDLPAHPGESEPAPQIICRKAKRQHFFHEWGEVADSNQMHEQLVHVAGIYKYFILTAIQFPAMGNFSCNHLTSTHFHQHPKGPLRSVWNSDIVFKGSHRCLGKTGPPQGGIKTLSAHRFVNRINGNVFNYFALSAGLEIRFDICCPNRRNHSIRYCQLPMKLIYPLQYRRVRVVKKNV